MNIIINASLQKVSLTVLFFCFLTGTLSAQNYEEQTPEVRNKMDQNKYEGKDLLDGLTRVMTLEVESCGTQEKAAVTLSVLSDLSGFKRFIFVSSGTITIYINASADYTRVRDFLIAHGVNVFHFRGEKFEL